MLQRSNDSFGEPFGPVAQFFQEKKTDYCKSRINKKGLGYFKRTYCRLYNSADLHSLRFDILKTTIHSPEKSKLF
jgi:hypothetical protein